MCEQVGEQLRMYESQLKIAEQQLGLELDKEKREQVPLQQRQREAQERLRHEGAKLADNDKAADKTTSMLAQSQRELGEPLNFNFGEVIDEVRDGEKPSSSRGKCRSTLLYGDSGVVANDPQSKPFSGFSAVADDMQSKPSSGFSAKFEKEVSSSAGEVSVVAQDDALVDRVSITVLAAVQAALRAELDASFPGPIARMRWEALW
jgi:hypothetical protein